MRRAIFRVPGALERFFGRPRIPSAATADAALLIISVPQLDTLCPRKYLTSGLLCGRRPLSPHQRMSQECRQKSCLIDSVSGARSVAQSR